MHVIYILIACIFWGGDPIIRYPLVEGGISIQGLVFWEHVLMVLLVSPYIPGAISIIRKDRQLLILFILLGCISSALATLTFTRAFTYLSPSLVILLQKLKTFTGLILAAWLLKEKPGREFYFWSGIAIIGALLVSFPHIEAFLSEKAHHREKGAYAFIGYGLVGITILGWGGGTVLARMLMERGVKPMTLMAGRYGIGLGCLIPLVAQDVNLLPVSGDQAVKIFLMTLFSGYVAVRLFYKGLEKVNASITSILELFSTLFAVSMS